MTSPYSGQVIIEQGLNVTLCLEMALCHKLVMSLCHYLRRLCRYVPKGPEGLTELLVGGDRLTEANSRNIQWAFADGDTKEERMEGMVFKFEDWHAIRVLFEVSNLSESYQSKRYDLVI